LDKVQTDVFSKIVSVFDKAIDPEVTTLSFEDRAEIARFYLEYLQEYAPHVSMLRATEFNLKN
jgi:hypothetical protein